MTYRTDGISRIKIALEENYTHLDDAETQIVDLLVDLHHFCSNLNIDFDRVLRYARNQYRKEGK